MLPYHKNPARILGTGLFANVLGILLGSLIGSAGLFSNVQSPNSALLALSVVCVTLVMLPPLHGRLSMLLKDHAYMTVLNELPPQEKTLLMHNYGAENKLTEREREIAALMLTGLTCRMIAKELCVSENTVKTHSKNIYSKVGVHNRTELINSLMDLRSNLKE
jgi:DNA-binding NarL/FixJ family response regulator